MTNKHKSDMRLALYSNYTQTQNEIDVLEGEMSTVVREAEKRKKLIRSLTLELEELRENYKYLRVLKESKITFLLNLDYALQPNKS